ncbi:MAG: hypothetical protein ACJ8EF_11390 [Bradyrhizobium sp.]|jgi:hypothetical protein
MLSRALRLATVGLLIGATPVLAQVQNLEAGKSPAQIFAGTCTACHKAPRGLLKTVAPGSLPGFLRQHYTTSSEMASLLAGFLVSNGAADTRYAGSAKNGEKPEARAGGAPDQLDRFGRRFRPGPQEAARPEADPREAARTDAPVPESQRSGRNARRFAPPADIPAENQEPAQASNERGPDGRRLSAKQKLSKRGKPGGEESPRSEPVNAEAANEEPPKSEAAQTDTPKIENPKTETAKSETARSETASVGDAKTEAIKPSAAETRSEPVRLEASKDTGNSESPAARPDAVPQVTPTPAVAAAISGGTRETSPVGPAPQTQPQTLTASAPPPVPPAGPPAPPISR